MTAARHDPPPEERAVLLKERVYITFTALAVVLALRTHDGPAGEAALTLTVAVTGTLLAVLVADMISYIAVHAVLPARPQRRHMVRASFGSLGALVLPFIFVGLAVLDVWSIERALRAASIALVAALVAIGYLGIRRVRLPTWQRIIVLLGEFVLGLTVVGLELLLHG